MRSLGKLVYDVSQNARVAWYGGHYALAEFLAPPLKAPIPEPGSMPRWQEIRADLHDLLERDWKNIEAGLYKPPVDILPNPIRELQKSFHFIRDLPAINQRRRHGTVDEPHRANGKDNRYPRYFLQNFHFQTGGYLGADSAALYDHQVEVLFTGGADAMRRQLLPHLRTAITRHKTQEGTVPHLLDVACGTARFLKEVRHNWPALPCTGIDLSADYLAHAERDFGRGGPTFLQGNAERLPFADDGLPLIACIYLFHELPRKVRRTVLADMIRCLAPGGRLLFMDSIQLGDHPRYDRLLDRFPLAFHEPYYRDYIRDDLDGLFAGNGLTTIAKERAFFSTYWVLEKPTFSRKSG